ncbi:IS1634 family transposase [Amycolatopsis anabasis]|uniref:IS1634 family transposase n=1 Tax=Amycolatopsis anabasis TaxID=1840409 RepID=UPI00131BE4B7|nr:transposase [Amycolatopsis anabasis]
MASVIGKRRNGQTYYYLAKSARVDGEPRIVSQRYLGTAEDIERAFDGGAAAPPRDSRRLAFGDVAAVWSTVDKLGLVRLVDAAVGPQRAKVSVGTYLALAVLHRATAPNTSLRRWWPGTAADRFVRPRLARAAVTEDRCWRALQRLTREHLDRIEAAVCAAVGERLPGPALALDVPNFATFTGADPNRAGHEAALHGLGLVVTMDGAVPLVASGYRRNRPGIASFGALAEELAGRHCAMTGAGEVTLVFDTGQYSQLDLSSGRHFVGSLPLGDHPELLARPASARRPVDPERFPGVTALDTRATVAGARRRLVLTHSPTLHAAQARGFAQALSNATRELEGLAAALDSGAYRHGREQVLSDIARITRARRVDRVLPTEVTGTKPGSIRLAWRIDEAARARLDEEFFGKQLLVTDHEDWPLPDVITAYRARYHLDSTFRRLNDPFVAGPAPRWCWTEDRITVHALVCVLAAAVTHLMRREADRAGLNLSVRELMDQLAGIGETLLRYPSTGGRPRTHRLLTDRDETQQRLFDLFNLAAYAP